MEVEVSLRVVQIMWQISDGSIYLYVLLKTCTNIPIPNLKYLILFLECNNISDTLDVKNVTQVAPYRVP